MAAEGGIKYGAESKCVSCHLVESEHKVVSHLAAGSLGRVLGTRASGALFLPDTPVV